MKKLLLLAIMLMSFMVAFADEVENEYSFFKKSPETDVTNLRLGLIYTENRDVSGVDVNWLVSKSRKSDGVKVFGFLNMDEQGGEQTSVLTGIDYSKGDVKGNVILGFASVNKSHEGFRLSEINWSTEKAKGTNIAFVNYSKEMVGIQFGLFNFADQLDGYQIGLINYAKNSDLFMILPIFNMGGKK